MVMLHSHFVMEAFISFYAAVDTHVYPFFKVGGSLILVPGTVGKGPGAASYNL